MIKDKKVSRKEFLKILTGTLFSFVCFFKFSNVNFANNKTQIIDSNDAKY